MKKLYMKILSINDEIIRRIAVLLNNTGITSRKKVCPAKILKIIYRLQ